MQEHAIYVVFSATPNRIGKMIRLCTGGVYNHVSISLDRELTQMFSFARRYYATPFYGGFVQETVSRFHTNRQPSTVRICRIPVTQHQYAEVSALLKQMYRRRHHYLYNHLSALTVPFRKPIAVKDAFTCTEFCVHILNRLRLCHIPQGFCSLENLSNLLSDYCIYEGPIHPQISRDYTFYTRKPVAHPFLVTARDFLKLFTRIKN